MVFLIFLVSLPIDIFYLPCTFENYALLYTFTIKTSFRVGNLSFSGKKFVFHKRRNSVKNGDILYKTNVLKSIPIKLRWRSVYR